MLDNKVTSIKYKKQESFGYDVFKLVSGTTLSQLLLILAAPFLARLYEPEAFGIAALFTSITGTITAISCLGYELSIILPEDEKEAANLMGLSFIIAASVSVFTIPIVFLVGPVTLNLLRAPDLIPYLWLIPITIFFGGTSLGHPSLNFWNTRTKHFSRLSVTQVISVLVTVILQLYAGYLGYASGVSLLGSAIVGSVISTIVLGWLVWRQDGRFFQSNINWRDMLTGFTRYRKFPLFESGAGLLNTVSWQLPAFLLAAFFSPIVVGYYSIGNRLLKLPMGLVANSVGRVFFQRAAQAKIKGTLTSLVESVFKRLVMLGLFPMMILAIIGGDLFTVVFGQEWTEAGIYTQILSIWVFFWFISTPLSNLFRVLEKQEFSLFINIAILLTRFLALWLGGILGNARFALFFFSISGILVYGYLSVAVISASGVSKHKVLSILSSNFMLFVPFGLLLLSLKYIFSTPPIITVGIAGILLGAYFVYVARIDPEIRILISRSTSRIQKIIARAIKASH